MLATMVCPEPALAITRRQTNSLPPPERLRLVRPSLLDHRVRGDFCVVAYDRDTLGLCVNNVPLAVLTGTAMDQACFSNLVSRVRGRYPRQKPRTR